MRQKCDAVRCRPSGATLQLFSSSRFRELAGTGVGVKLWPSATALCRWLRTADCVCQCSILELGCGTGAVGIYCAGLGASQVLLTDAGTPALLELTQRNIDANQQQLTCIPSLMRYKWGDDLPAGTFDLVVASDVTYARAAHDALAATMARLLQAEPRPRIVIAHEHRTFLGATADGRLRHFRKRAAEHGLLVQLVHAERQARHGLRDISILEITRAQ
jgi:predicted nicotinamide N-methyase